MKTLDRFKICENDIVDEYLSSKHEEISPNITSSTSSDRSEQEEGTILHSDQMDELLENDSIREEETAMDLDLPEKNFTTRRGPGRPKTIRTGKPGRPRKSHNCITEVEEANSVEALDPVNIEEALEGPDNEEWTNAIIEEF